MQYVYLMRSKVQPDQRYVGTTRNLRARLNAHNAGQSLHTTKYKPWEIVGYFAFLSAQRAFEFEKYLKSGSGRAFAAKRLW
jgi:putative endonuclease